MSDLQSFLTGRDDTSDNVSWLGREARIEYATKRKHLNGKVVRILQEKGDLVRVRLPIDGKDRKDKVVCLKKSMFTLLDNKEELEEARLSDLKNAMDVEELATRQKRLRETHNNCTGTSSKRLPEEGSHRTSLQKAMKRKEMWMAKFEKAGGKL